jgi:type III pantothenate kinase
MLLAIDAGNTETVVGLFALTDAHREAVSNADGGLGIGAEAHPAHGLTHHWRLSSVPDRTADEHAVLLTQLLDLEGLDVADAVTGIAVCSSVPEITTTLRQMAARWLSDRPCVILGPGTRSGMPILYDNPREVGPDRIADAVGAYDLFGGPCIVVDLGTATTFEVISGAGEYMGGAIMPGIAVGLEALYQQAAALRRVELVEPRNVIGRTTAESIQSGTLYGSGVLVDGMCRLLQSELGTDATTVATGGLAELIAPYASAVEHVEPWLTLHGLRIVYERNVGGAG